MRWGARSIGHVVRGGAVVVVALISLAADPDIASAATPCHSVEVESTKIRVAVVDVQCERGREVAVGYFERALDEDHFDGKTGDGSIYYKVAGFRCLTGLGVLPTSRRIRLRVEQAGRPSGGLRQARSLRVKLRRRPHASHHRSRSGDESRFRLPRCRHGAEEVLPTCRCHRADRRRLRAEALLLRMQGRRLSLPHRLFVRDERASWSVLRSQGHGSLQRGRQGARCIRGRPAPSPRDGAASRRRRQLDARRAGNLRIPRMDHLRRTRREVGPAAVDGRRVPRVLIRRRAEIPGRQPWRPLQGQGPFGSLRRPPRQLGGRRRGRVHRQSRQSPTPTPRVRPFRRRRADRPLGRSPHLAARGLSRAPGCLAGDAGSGAT